MFVQKNIKKYEDNFVSLLVKVTNFKKKNCWKNLWFKYFLIKLDKLYHRRIIITSNDTKYVFSLLKRNVCFKYYQIVTNLNLLIIINDWWITNFIYLRVIIPPFIFRRLIDKIYW